MPNLWYLNMDEEAQGVNDLDSAQVCRDILSENARNLLNLVPGDLAILPNPVDASFVKYCEGFTGGHLVCAATSTIDQSAIRALCAKEQFTLQPYIQTPKAIKFSHEVGARWCGTDPALVEQGLIVKANSKVFIKSIADAVGIKVAPYSIESSLDGLLSGIKKFSSVHHDLLFLKKDGMCGGLGNISGSLAELKRIVPSWYKAGTVVLEPKLPLCATLGSFVDIQPNHVEFLGVDEQFFNGYEWGGFVYPHRDVKNVEWIRDASIQIGKKLRQHGLIGSANFDWLVLAENYPQAGFDKGDVVLGECNFRYTGVHPAINFARRYFRSSFSDINIKSYVQHPVCDQFDSFSSLYNRLEAISHNGTSLLCRPGSQGPMQGVLITQPPRDNKCGITIFAHDRNELESYACLVLSALS